MAAKGKERRRFPRKPASVKVRILAGGLRDVSFEASLPSVDVSIGGVFLESEFFLRMGTELRVEFELPGAAEKVVASGPVVREQRISSKGDPRTGFAIQFTRYEEGARLALATYFLSPEVLRFVQEYRRSSRPQRIRGEVERMVDLVVAWEMDRLERGGAVDL